jgi:hypothetical protein
MKRYIIFFFLVLASIRSAKAFEIKPISNGDTNTFRIWNVTQGPVRISVNPQGSEDLSLNEVESELQKAIAVWQKVTGSVRLEYAGQNSNALFNDSDQINSVLWEEKQWDYSSTTLAITRYTYIVGEPAYMVDADILFNGKNFQWSTDQKVNGDTADFQQVLSHEIGHLFGLSHSAAFKATLYPYLPDKVKHTLHKDDRKGLQFLYDAPVSAFVMITPVSGASYPDDILDMALPLPVFRWYPGINTSFTLEFSSTKDFKQKISFPSGAETSRMLSSAEAKKLLDHTASGKIFWRVSSETTSTKPRRLKFANVS